MTKEEYEEFYDIVLELPLHHTSPNVDKAMLKIFEWLCKHTKCSANHIVIDKDSKVYSIN